tara:strand:+ start:551 stop:730 length:180 start_codon:yes stop_codon:yes gene_type:complete
MAKTTIEEALAKAVESFEDHTGEIVVEDVPAMVTRTKILLARKKNLQRKTRNKLPTSLK